MIFINAISYSTSMVSPAQWCNFVISKKEIMKLTNRTILVTGGNSGIGYETAKLLIKQGNKVIITGRDVAKLEKAGAALGADIIPVDVTKAEDVASLVAIIEASYSELSVLINNAGGGKVYRLGEVDQTLKIAREEFDTNYFGTIRLTESLLPLLKKQPEAAIVNLGSNVAFHPLVVLPTYSDSKAALHSYTIALRLTLANTSNIKLFEVFPSLIDTEGTRALGLNDGLPASVAAENIAEGIEQDHYEIFVGEAGKQRTAFLADPEAAILSFNKGLI
ncbi:SDR family oxidoreductase [Mucilaginibacter sp. AK015]|uniref:SDR family oxidoreductase n=1 Tax=Mucilaginibacter sp. AK015 TaxID=2723072 RepID=UPI0017A6F6B0|nr:SDR family NAD(P)-dependent oxidoreductase [Mucilaginibacter sp. AK015]MBB5395226.1 putative oxidoreductase [Mucilaginibacter sp. AK015]